MFGHVKAVGKLLYLSPDTWDVWKYTQHLTALQADLIWSWIPFPRAVSNCELTYALHAGQSC